MFDVLVNMFEAAERKNDPITVGERLERAHSPNST